MYKTYNPILSYVLYISGLLIVFVIAYLFYIGDDELYFTIFMACLSFVAFYMGLYVSKFTIVINEVGITYNEPHSSYFLPWEEVKSVGICLRKTIGGSLPYIYITAQEKEYYFIFIPDNNNFILYYRASVLREITKYWRHEVNNISLLRKINK